MTTLSNETYIILNQKQILPENGIIKTFLLPNKKAAFLFSDYEITGRYTKNITSHLYLITEDEKQLIASYLYQWNEPPSLYLDFRNFNFTKKWDYKKLEWDEYEEDNIKWENVLKIDKEDHSFSLCLGDSLEYKTKLDKKGQ